MSAIRETKLITLLLGISLFSGTTLASVKASTESSAVSTASITVPVACTMRGTGVDSHTATLAPNTYSGASDSEYANGIGKTTLTAICNDDNGFSIYAIGYTNNQYEGENHTKLVGQSTNSTISTKAYASGDTTSNWSMKLTKVTDSTISYNPQNLTISSDAEGSFDTWHSVPDAYTKVAEYHANTGSSTTDTTLGVKLETTYAAYISSSQPADTYVGQVKYTMVHPYSNTPKDGPITNCPANSICYSPNANDIEGTMGQQPITDSDTSATLLASNFSRTGYGFAGWSDRYDYSNDNGAKFYGPQETISFDAGKYSTTNGGLRLYAIWIKSEGSIQDEDKVASVCNSLTTAPTDGTANLKSVSAFTDQRDNETYAIARLADGNCWMIENLRLDNSAALTIANTNNPLNDGTNVTIKHNYADTTTSNTLSPTSNVVYNADTAPNGWCTTNSAACDDQSRLRTNNTANRATYTENQNVTSQDANIYSYGNYYNWYSATAGRGTYSFSTYNKCVAGDLCPVGWHLPTGGLAYASSNTGSVNVTGKTSTFREFYNLSYKTMNEIKTAYEDTSNNGFSAYTLTTNNSGKTATQALRSYPNNFLYSGYVDGGFLVYRAIGGFYWSSTARSTGLAFSLRLYGSSVSPGTLDYYKYVGRTVRCVAGS